MCTQSAILIRIRMLCSATWGNCESHFKYSKCLSTRVSLSSYRLQFLFFVFLISFILFFFFFQLDFLFPPRPIDGFHTSRTRVPVELCRCTLLGKRMTARVSSIYASAKREKGRNNKNSFIWYMCVSTALLHQAHVHISFDLFSPDSIFFLYSLYTSFPVSFHP